MANGGLGDSQTQNNATGHARVLAQSKIQKREIIENGQNGKRSGNGSSSRRSRSGQAAKNE